MRSSYYCDYTLGILKTGQCFGNVLCKFLCLNLNSQWNTSQLLVHVGTSHYATERIAPLTAIGFMVTSSRGRQAIAAPWNRITGPLWGRWILRKSPSNIDVFFNANWTIGWTNSRVVGNLRRHDAPLTSTYNCCGVACKGKCSGDFRWSIALMPGANKEG